MDHIRSLLLPVILISMLPVTVAGQESQQIWACVSEVGQINVLNSTTFSVDSRFNVTGGDFPWAIAFTPDGKWAFVVCRDTDNVVVLGASTLEERGTIDVGREPFAIEITSDGEQAYVTNGGDGTVSVISTMTRGVEATISVGTMPRSIVISRDGKYAFVCLYGEDRVAVIGVEDGSVYRKIEVGDGPWGVDVTTDDRRIYVSCHDEDMVYAIDLDEDRIVKKIDANEGPRGVSVIPDVHRVYVTAKEAVAIIDAVQNVKIDASGIHGEGWEGAIRPDGAYIFVSTVDHGEGIVEVIDISRMEKIESIWLGEGIKFPRGLAIRPLLSSGRVSTLITCLGPGRVPFNETMLVFGVISPPLPGREVTLHYEDPDGSTIPREVTTTLDGGYSDSFSPDVKGSWKVTASWPGDDGHQGASSPVLEFRVGGAGGPSKGSGPLPLIILIAVIIVMVVILRRRR